MVQNINAIFFFFFLEINLNNFIDPVKKNCQGKNKSELLAQKVA